MCVWGGHDILVPCGAVSGQGSGRSALATAVQLYEYEYGRVSESKASLCRWWRVCVGRSQEAFKAEQERE